MQNGKMKKVVVKSDPAAIMQHLEQSLQIDEYSLEEALQAQPDLFWRVSKKLAQLAAALDEAKAELAEIDANVDADIRGLAEREERKITNPEVEATKLLDKQIQDAADKVRSLKRELGLWGALKEAYEQRSYSLKTLADLYCSNYYGASPENANTRRMKQLDADITREALRKKNR